MLALSFALVAAALAGDVQADLHLDTPTQILRKGVGLDGAGLEAGLPQLRAGGTTLAVMVMWPPRDASWDSYVDKLLTTMEKEDARLDAVQLARTPAEARALANAGKVAIVYSLEGAHGIDKGGLPALRALHGRGVELLGLTWSFSNRYAGSSGDGGGGLTEAGKELVKEANRLGMLVDVSHASKATTLDACATSTGPVIASHSDAMGVTVNKRNLSDEEIRCIAKSGGVIGLNFHSTFVGKPASIARIADHADYLRKIGGAGVVALGSDFDGLIVPPADAKDASHIGALWVELRKRGWTEDEIRGVRGENFLRAWQGAIDGRSDQQSAISDQPEKTASPR
jgi:membrane dipeptidase